MKKIMIFLMSFASLVTRAQMDTTFWRDTSPIKIIEPGDSTAFGTPEGKLTEKEIGPAGGTIISDDGRVELMFPAGALASNTKITIQPTTNPAPNGEGKAYQFEPSGTQFAVPVEIVFHYSDEDSKSCSPILMALGMQDAFGKWSFFDYDDWDSSAKILKTSIRHFSGAAPNVAKYKLAPDKHLVRVNQSVGLTIIDISKKLKGAGTPTIFSKWFVESQEGGNSSVGTVGDIMGNSARYTAPSQMPMPNPVTVSVRIQNGSRTSKTSCEVEIFDGYELTVDANWTFLPADRDDVQLRIQETSSIVFEIQATGSPGEMPATKWKVDELSNPPPVVTIIKCPERCTCRLKRGQFSGLVEIVGISNITIANNMATVSFEKVAATFPGFDVSCETRPIDIVPNLPAAPIKATFALKDGRQEIPFPDLGDNGLMSIKFTYTIYRVHD